MPIEDQDALIDPLRLDALLEPQPFVRADDTGGIERHPEAAVTSSGDDVMVASDDAPATSDAEIGVMSDIASSSTLLRSGAEQTRPEAAEPSAVSTVEIDPSRASVVTAPAVERMERRETDDDDSVADSGEPVIVSSPGSSSAGGDFATASDNPTPDPAGPHAGSPPIPPDVPPLNVIGSYGNDTLEGGGGDDTLDGSFGDDVLLGHGGNDRLLGNVGADALYGGDGDDYAFGASGNDTLDGGAGNDELRGGFDADLLIGGDGDDYLNGWSGNDTLAGGGGDDFMEGADGHDTYVIGAGAPGGVDTILDSAGDDVLLFDGLNPFEHVSSVVQAGDDLVFDYAGGGNLTVRNFYGSGEVEILRYDGVDYATNADASSPVSFADFIAGTDDLILGGGDGADTLNGGAGNDRISGGAGNDTLFGAAGADEISGGDGADTIQGNDGDDILYGAGDGALDFYGADTLSGGGGQDTLFGGGGDDTLSGGADNDRILGEFGNDTGFGDDGDDYLFGDFGDDTLDGGIGDDEVRGGFGNDTLIGGGGNDFLDGYIGNDRLDGGTGTDVLVGGDGNDTFVMRRGSGGDTVTDFTAFSVGAAYADRIDLSDYGYSGFGDLSLSQDGADAVIDLGGGDELTLEGVGTDSLGAEDFTF